MLSRKQAGSNTAEKQFIFRVIPGGDQSTLLWRGSLFLLLAVALCLLAFVRLEPLFEQTLRFDELTSYLMATGHFAEYVQIYSSGAPPAGEWVPAAAWQQFLAVGTASDPQTVVQDLLTYDIHPPLYFLLLRGWLEAAGNSYLSSRLLSWFLDLATAGLIVLCGRTLFEGRWAGWFAGLIWLVSPLAVEGSAWVRQYSLLTCFSVLFTLLVAQVLFTHLTPRRTAAQFLALALVGCLGLLTQYTFVFIAGAGVIALLLFGRRSPLLRYIFLIVLALLPLALLLAGHRQPFAVPIFLSRQLSTAGFSAQRLPLFLRSSLLLSLPLALPVAATAVAVWQARRQQQRLALVGNNETRRVFGFSLVMLLVPWTLYALSYMAGIFAPHARMAHHLLFLTPFVALCTTAWLEILPRPLPRNTAVATAGLLIMLLLISTVRTGRAVKSAGSLDMQALANYDVIVIDSIKRPESFTYLQPQSSVFAATQETLLEEQEDWLPRLVEDGGVFITLSRSGPFPDTDPELRQRLLGMIENMGTVRLIGHGSEYGTELSMYEVAE
ncbi:MAG: glycosyltransferase family 39 protein [Candidatus Promineifilaceae bacterium]